MTETTAPTAAKIVCPICEGEDFREHTRRKHPRCTRCGSLPRTRSAWLLLNACLELGPHSRIAHFAPEPGIAARLHAACATGYERYDLTPGRYHVEGLPPAGRFDLCRDVDTLPRQQYDAVIHNHVLEHLPCNYTIVLQQLHARLKPGGIHIFSVPMTSGYSREDLDPRLTREERRERYLQEDHIRKFGREDMEATIGMVFGLTRDYSLTDFVPPKELLRAAIPEETWAPSGSTVFAVRA
ncbi:hypothetical protein DRV85_02270 [Rhodosalinus halophilus]|jgi:hypothetical protein|uniref:Methyltransferase domain-containing protein n=1 Tax=Rhodosalinus halophilus TaxID=2259333 RepID=A0A365UC28_9RHOB|nr:methyltransferase domain-containing protein [Rhodosalinus halophilus]RBI86970.1 hypothetical protein DRV85_02270 [Rhodosalinus halophilus]